MYKKGCKIPWPATVCQIDSRPFWIFGFESRKRQRILHLNPRLSLHRQLYLPILLSHRISIPRRPIPPTKIPLLPSSFLSNDTLADPRLQGGCGSNSEPTSPRLSATSTRDLPIPKDLPSGPLDSSSYSGAGRPNSNNIFSGVPRSIRRGIPYQTARRLPSLGPTSRPLLQGLIPLKHLRDDLARGGSTYKATFIAGLNLHFVKISGAPNTILTLSCKSCGEYRAPLPDFDARYKSDILVLDPSLRITNTNIASNSAKRCCC